jgi:cation:H+ antiporter
MIISLTLFIGSFILLWIGSGIALTAVTKISHSLRISSFFVSFIILGLFTSLSEIMVGINSIIGKQPEVLVGNLIGSSVVVFLLIIPLLAVVGNGIKLNHFFSLGSLLTAAAVVGLPALLTLDNQFSRLDAFLCIALFGYFIYIQERHNGYLESLASNHFSHATIYRNLVKIVFAILLIFAASSVLVSQTTVIGEALGVTPFILSLLVIALGTNIPELSIAIRAILANQKAIAFGNYVGSASINTLIVGSLTLANGASIRSQTSNLSIFLFTLGLITFIYFAKSQRHISRLEGLGLLAFYALFVIFEITAGLNWSF